MLPDFSIARADDPGQQEASLLSEAQRLVTAGRSLIPIKADGSKQPALTWKPYQSRRPTNEALTDWFSTARYGVALLTGAISGYVEVLDFDATELFSPWADIVDNLAPGLLERLPVVQTPTGGRHVFYRCEQIAGNAKLAIGLDKQTLVETRGEGGYVLIPPSPPACHPSHKPYRLLDGDLGDIPEISPDERTVLLRAARSFNQYRPPERIIIGGHDRGRVANNPAGRRPGDDYEARARWEDLLLPEGHAIMYRRGDVTYWRRAGKEAPGISATTNYGDSGLLYGICRKFAF